MLEAGRIYAGQPVDEFLALIRPVEVTQDGNFTSYHFAEVPNYGGLTVVAKAGELVAALDWTDCAPPLIYFNTMSEAERSEYHKRTHLLPPPRAES